MNKFPDRIYISKDDSSVVVKEIEKTQFLDLHNSKTTRIELFLFAMALGSENPIDLDGKEGFVLESNINEIHKALIYSLFYYYNIKDGENFDQFLNKENVYEYVQKCAHSGFQQIEYLMKNKNLENVHLELIDQIDQLWDDYVRNS